METSNDVIVHDHGNQQIDDVEEEIFKNLVKLGSGYQDKPFISLTKLKLNCIYVISKVVRREKGIDNSQFNSIVLETKTFRTGLPRKCISLH